MLTEYPDPSFKALFKSLGYDPQIEKAQKNCDEIINSNLFDEKFVDSVREQLSELKKMSGKKSKEEAISILKSALSYLGEDSIKLNESQNTDQLNSDRKIKKTRNKIDIDLKDIKRKLQDQNEFDWKIVASIMKTSKSSAKLFLKKLLDMHHIEKINAGKPGANGKAATYSFKKPDEINR